MAPMALLASEDAEETEAEVKRWHRDANGEMLSPHVWLEIRRNIPTDQPGDAGHRRLKHLRVNMFSSPRSSPGEFAATTATTEIVKKSGVLPWRRPRTTDRSKRLMSETVGWSSG